jgi:uncharacterized membrane protein
MENRKVGYLIVAIALLIAFIVYSFNTALLDIISSTCSHGSECPMYGSLGLQTNISVAILIFVAVVGLYLIIFGKEKVMVIEESQIKKKEITLENYRETLDKMDMNERRVFEKLIEEKGSMLQSALIRHTGFTKVKMTRILDKLEQRDLIERKRRGMTNIVRIKQ